MNPDSFAATSPAPVHVAPRRSHTLMWSVRRELWENRAVYVAPLAAGAIYLIGFLVRLVAAPGIIVKDIVAPYTFATFLIMGTGVVVGIFYSLDALYAERRDRSILFWKSLPVSDSTTVLAKAAIPVLVIPLLTTAITVVVHIVMLLSSIVGLSLGGLPVYELWRKVALLNMTLDLMYHMVTIHVLWYAPIFAWLLLASACARRAAFLWAGIPILAIAVLEQLILDSSHFLNMLQSRLVGGLKNISGSSDPLAHVSPGLYVRSPDLWIGLAIAMVFLATAVQVRRRNSPA